MTSLRGGWTFRWILSRETRLGVFPSRWCARLTEESHPVRATAATILVLAAWIGLIAGFLDLGLMVVNRRLIEGDFYRLGGDFAWIIPAGVTVLVLVPAIVLVLIARIRGGAVRLGVAVGLLSFVGFFDMSARLPLDLWASLLLCGGLAVQSARLVGRRRAAFLRLVRRTVPLLAGALLTIMLVTIGGRAWSEHRAAAALPAAPAGARNVLLIVWDTVRAGNLSALRLRATDDAQPGAAGRPRGAVRPGVLDVLAGPCLRTPACSPGGGPMSWASTGNRPSATMSPRSPEYLAAHGYDTAGFAANLDYCTRETGLARGFAHYEDFPIDLYEAFARYVALGNRLEISDWAGVLGRLLEKCSGRSFDEADTPLEGACEERRGGGPGVPGVALSAAGAPPPLLCLPELQ